jgi:hypothetical protein
MYFARVVDAYALGLARTAKEKEGGVNVGLDGFPRDGLGVEARGGVGWRAVA